MNSTQDKVVSVSVIIPCHNCENTIARAVKSIAQQTWLPEEVILINDASTDKTLHAIQLLVQEYGDDWLKLLDFKSNCGPSIARNKGVDQVKSDYIAFLDADDSWHFQKLEIQYFWMQAHPEVSMTGHIMAMFPQQRNDGFFIDKDNVVVTKLSKFKMLISNPFSTPTVMMRSNIPKRFDRDQHYAEDYLLWLNVFFSFGEVYRIEKKMAYMYKGVYGEKGLSQDLVAMEKGEIETYSKIYKRKNINLIQYGVLIVLSLAKFVRRVILIRIVKRLV